MSESTQQPRIATLPQGVADRIAAGEVVERPAAVVKELIENALDSDARHITIIIQDSGRTLIRIVDDGYGMTDAELAIAIGRHSTSKLRRFEDLESLQTFGFRGEALPSIAAVSRLEIISRRHDADVGAVLKVSGGSVNRCEPTSAPPGTSVSISHLFYNVPARRKFLRSDSTEFKWIATVFRQFALAFPKISWELHHGKNKLYDLPAATPRDRLAVLFGDDVAEELIEIDHERSWMRIKGFISPPSLTQRNRDSQYLFLNHRPIVHARLNHAVYTSCEPYFVSGGHPLYVIFLEASPERFDINVHPAKKQVKFADENGAYSALWSAVRSSIAENRTPEELATKPQSEVVPVHKPLDRVKTAQEVPVKSPSHLKPYIPIDRQYKAPRGPVMPFPPDREDRDEELSLPSPMSEPSLADLKAIDNIPYPIATENIPADRLSIWQVFNSFLISPLKTGLAFIDQHIAHERILYEKALAAMEHVPWDSQQLLFPPVIKVAPEDVALVEEALPLLRAMGFVIEPFGPLEFRIEAVPSGIRVSDEREMVLGIIDEYREGSVSESDPRKRIAAGFACQAAIKAGQPLEPEEMQRLIEELFQTEDPEFCPHGRPIYHVLGRKEIEKWFKRG